MGLNAVHLVVAHISEVGRVRSNNEDSVLVLNDENGGGDLLVVADGMGGARAGELASRLAVETVAETFRANANGGGATLAEAIQAANVRILSTSQENPEVRGMGTTCSAVVVRGNQLSLAHVGDCRVYRLRGGLMLRLSRDHSMWAERVRCGEPDASPAQVVGRNELTRAVGVESLVEPDSLETDVQVGDQIVICSDGLWGIVTDPEMLSILQVSEPEEACQHLADLANARGAPDNISVIIAEACDGDAPSRSE